MHTHEQLWWHVQIGQSAAERECGVLWREEEDVTNSGEVLGLAHHVERGRQQQAGGKGSQPAGRVAVEHQKEQQQCP